MTNIIPTNIIGIITQDNNTQVGAGTINPQPTEPRAQMDKMVFDNLFASQMVKNYSKNLTSSQTGILKPFELNEQIIPILDLLQLQDLDDKAPETPQIMVAEQEITTLNSQTGNQDNETYSVNEANIKAEQKPIATNTPAQYIGPLPGQNIPEKQNAPVDNDTAQPQPTQELTRPNPIVIPLKNIGPVQPNIHGVNTASAPAVRIDNNQNTMAGPAPSHIVAGQAGNSDNIQQPLNDIVNQPAKPINQARQLPDEGEAQPMLAKLIVGENKDKSQYIQQSLNNKPLIMAKADTTQPVAMQPLAKPANTIENTKAGDNQETPNALQPNNQFNGKVALQGDNQDNIINVEQYDTPQNIQGNIQYGPQVTNPGPNVGASNGVEAQSTDHAGLLANRTNNDGPNTRVKNDDSLHNIMQAKPQLGGDGKPMTMAMDNKQPQTPNDTSDTTQLQTATQVNQDNIGKPVLMAPSEFAQSVKKNNNDDMVNDWAKGADKKYPENHRSQKDDELQIQGGDLQKLTQFINQIAETNPQTPTNAPVKQEFLQYITQITNRLILADMGKSHEFNMTLTINQGLLAGSECQFTHLPNSPVIGVAISNMNPQNMQYLLANMDELKQQLKKANGYDFVVKFQKERKTA